MSDHVRYIDRTRDYYRSQGYDKDYEWAQFDDVPFARLTKPLSECCVALVSTSEIAVRGDPEAENPAETFLVGNAYSIPSDTPIERLYSHQEHFDRAATHIDDVNSFFPITRLHEAVTAGKIGSVAASAHGVYVAYSQRKTRERDGPEILKRCRADGVDAVVLTPV